MRRIGESTCIVEINAFRIDLSGVFSFSYYETSRILDISNSEASCAFSGSKLNVPQHFLKR